MAYFSARPDGLVDADIGNGRMLPMLEEHARAGGLLPAPMPAIPVGNPASMANDPNVVAGPGGAPADDASLIANAMNNPQPTAPAPLTQGSYNGIPLPAPGRGFLDDTQQKGGAPRPEFAAGVEKLQAEAPHVNRDVPGDTHEQGLTRIDPNGGGEQRPAGIFGAQQGPGRIVQTSKGGDIRASFVRRPGEELDEGTKAYADSIDPEALRGQRETSVTNAAIARDNAVAADISATAKAEAQIEEQRQQVAKNRAILQQKTDIIDRRQKEAESATPQTRDEVLKSRGAVAGVLAGISIALGGYLQGMRGGENPGLKIVNDSIESEISSQRAKWEAMKDKIGAARSDFGHAMQLYGDPNMAEADMRMRSWQLAANMSAAHKAQGDNAEWLANQQQLTQQMVGNAAAEKQKWKNLADGQVVQENYQYHAPTFAQVGGPPKLNKDQREQMKEARERQIRLPDGNYAYAVNPAHVRTIQDKITAASNTLDAFGQIRSLLPKGGGPVTDPNVRKKIEAIQDRALSSLSASESQGVVTKADAERASATLSDINAIITDGGAGLQATESVVRNNMDATIRDNTYADPDATTPTRGGKATTFQPGL